FGGQVWFVPCDGLEHAEAIYPILSEASGLKHSSPAAGEPLVAELADRRALIFLDTADCLLEGGLREFLQPWLERAPGVTLLLTSQTPTGVSGEHLFPLRPMYPPAAVLASNLATHPLLEPVPGDEGAAAWLEADALRLF